MADPVVVYARGTPAQIAQQRDICLAWAAHKGQLVIAVASDDDTSSNGWQDANNMKAAGTVTKILMASTTKLPDYIESVTQEITPPNVRRPRRTTSPNDA